jgi:uncharacterized protein with GYD domain
MPTFMCFLNWTDQGAKNAKDATNRSQASQSMAKKLGGKLLSAYVTTGQYDVVLTLEMPNGEAMIKFVSAISASGNARTTTVRAYRPMSSANSRQMRRQCRSQSPRAIRSAGCARERPCRRTAEQRYDCAARSPRRRERAWAARCRGRVALRF